MTIIQQPDALSLSMNLKKFIISSDAQISFVLKKGTEEVLSQRYDPDSQGRIEIDMRDVVHAQLAFDFRGSAVRTYEQTNLHAEFTAEIDGQAVNFHAVRGGVDNLADTATNFLTQNWLTWQPTVKPVTYYTPEFLTYYAPVAGAVKLRGYFVGNDGQVTSQKDIELCNVEAGKAYTIPVEYQVVVSLLYPDGKPGYYDVWVENASGERLTYIQRYYADAMRSISEDWVLFENSLGGVDCFRAYGKTNLEADHSHNLAEVDEVSEEYRVDTERKYEKNTGHLSKDEARWLLDFFPSQKKYIYVGSYLRQIVVVESNVTGNLRELPTNYTFTYKYADARPLLNLPRTDVPADMLDITIPEVGNFTIPPRLAEVPRLPLSEGDLFPVQNPYSETWSTTTVGAIAEYIRSILTNTGSIGGEESAGNIDILKLNDSTAPSDSNVFSSLRVLSEVEKNNEKLNDRFLRKDQPDTTLYPVDFQGGLLVNSKRVSDIIRYYDEGDKVATDANVYSALMTDQRIEESLDGMDDRYLRKDQEDTARKHITFEEGITVYDLAKLMKLDVQELATIAQAVVKVLRSEKFVDGFAGEGYRIWQDIASGDWCFTIDRLTVRKVLTIYELVLQKIRSVGGMVVVSAANGKVKSAEKVGNSYVIEFEDTNMFVEHDLMRCQVFSAAGLKYYWVEISAVNGNQVIVPVSQFEGVVPAVGDECVLMGNTTDKLRQNLILISATEDGQPRFDCLDGVHSKSFEGCLKVRVGALSGISDSRFPADMQPQGYGLYGNNCYLTGIFVLANGKDVMTMFTIMEGMIKSEISSVRQEINEKDNYLSNASFTGNLQNWTGSNNIRIFRVSSRLLYFNSNFYANKEAFANIISTDEGRVLLRLKDSSVTQKNSDFAMHPEFELVDITSTDEDGTEEVIGQQYRPRMFFVSFRYKVNRSGTLRVYFKGESGAGFEKYSPIDYTEDLQVTDGFKRMEIAGKWDGTGDFFLSFTGDMYLYSLALADDALADLEEKFTLRFEMTDKKIQVNADEIKKAGEKLEEYHSEFLLTARELELKFTEDLQDMESSITAAYESYVSLTARDLTARFTADLSSAETRITEAYKSYINLTAQSLRTEFTADITDMQEGITEAYKSYVDLSAKELKAGFESDITDLRTGIAEAYEAAIELSATGLRTEFTSSIDGLRTEYSTLTQSVDQLTTQVAENKNAANAALTAAQNAATEAANAYSKAGQAYDKATDNATALVQTNASLSVIAGRFNEDGTLKEGAGWVTTAEANTLWVKKDGVISAINQTAESVTIDASRINLKGKVTISDLASGSGEGTIIEDGKIKADLIKTENLVVTGSMRSPFTNAVDSITTDYSDNIALLSSGGGWIDAYSLPWDVNQSGRKVCITNYRWGDSIAEGVAGLYAPAGKYFFENGTRKSKLMISRECIELLGYGDKTSFYGWIVLKRTDLMSEWQYGRPLKCLAMGVVIGKSTGVTSRYYTYNGDTLNISRYSTGRYNVRLPNGWFSKADDCFVVASGYGAADGLQLPASPIKATVANLSTVGFDIYTADDETVNDGGFTFMVYNLNDWS